MRCIHADMLAVISPNTVHPQGASRMGAFYCRVEWLLCPSLHAMESKSRGVVKKTKISTDLSSHPLHRAVMDSALFSGVRKNTLIKKINENKKPGYISLSRTALK